MNIPPNNQEIEYGTLSCALLNKDALLELIEKVQPEDYYYEFSRIFFECLKELYEKKVIPDLVSIRDLYSKKTGKELDQKKYFEIYETSVTSTNISHFIKELKTLRRKRELIKAGMEMQERAPLEDPEEIINDLGDKIRNITINEDNLKSSMDIFDKGIHQFRLNPKDFVKTGIVGFDEFFYGLYKSEVVTIAARPSEGKSALVLNIANYVSQELSVIFFSLEQPIFFQSIRLLAMETNIDSEDIMHNRLDQFQRDKLQEAANILKTRKLYIDDSPGLTGLQMVTRARRLYEKIGLGLAVFDYIQIFKNLSKDSRYLRISEDMKLIKVLARELNIPAIVVSQLGRDLEKRVNKIPLLSDLKESGSLEDDSDKVIFIHNDEDKLIMAKNKNGSKGNIPITFERAYSKFI